MKNKKGFTLIELLAVLVVLALIALITIPIVLGIISRTRQQANIRSIEAYGNAVEMAVSQYILENDIGDFRSIDLNDIKGDVEYQGTDIECDSLTVEISGKIILHGCHILNSNDSNIYSYNNGKIAKEYQMYHIGNEVTINKEKYYCIEDSDYTKDYVTVLKANPLTVDEVNNFGIGHINRYTKISEGTAVNVNGYGEVSYYASETCGYYNGWNSSGCKSDYESSEIKYIVDGWVANRVNNSDLKNIDGSVARLIKISELENLGYEPLENNIEVNASDSVPNWVYNSNYSYWSMYAYNKGSVLLIRKSGQLGGYNVDGRYGVVRPVINVYKNAIEE